MEEEVFSDEYGDVISDYPTKFSNGHHNNGFKAGRPRLESRMSICLPSKGLINEPGENNCFLNASIQLLWHVNVFRRSFRLLEGHACLESACIFCALKKIFHQLEDSDASVLAADELRQAMANAFMDERRFQLGRMDDAAECLENILTRLHCHIAWQESEDSCSALHCIPHQKFALNILEQTSCNCQATSEPKSFYQFVYYVHASALVEQAQLDRKYQLSFGELLRTTAQQGEKRLCPDEKRCLYKGEENTTYVQTTLLNRPDVLTVGIIWDTDCPSARYINDVMKCITETFFIVDLFDNVLDEEYKRLEMKLAGVVTYYGRHYTSFFYNINEQQWMYFDDAQVSKIGSSWKNVKQKCERTRFQPLLVVFTNASGLPVSIANALATTEFVSKDILLAVKPSAAKPSAHRKHHHNTHHRKKNRKNNRNGSRSPSQSPSKTNGVSDERISSRSSNGSQSPKSPRQNLTTPTTDSAKRTATLPTKKFLQAQHSYGNSDTLGSKKYQSSNEELSSLSNSTGSYSKPPKALIRVSASDGSIAERKNGECGGDVEPSSLRRKRSDSMKKKVGSVFKAMNPKYRSFKSSNKNSNNSNISNSNSVVVGPDKQEFLKPDAGHFADVGFTSVYEKPPKGEQSPVHSRDHSPSEPSPELPRTPKTQIKNLELHKEHLNSRIPHQTKDSPGQIYHNGHSDRRGSYGEIVDDDGVDGRLETSRYPQDQYGKVNSYNGYVSEQVELPDEFPDESIEEQFQGLLTKGDKCLSRADYYERKGDILYALQLCTHATAVFREASKLSGISEDLLQFVDSKRSESYQRSQDIQHSLNSFFDAKHKPESSSSSVSGRDPGGYHVRTGSTSGYSSMSDATIKSETSGNAYQYKDNLDGRRDGMNDLVSIQNAHARQQALERIRSDQQQQQSPPQIRRSHQHASADTLRRKSVELLEHNRSANNVPNPGSRLPPPRGLNLPRTSTMPVDCLQLPKISTPPTTAVSYDSRESSEQYQRSSFTSDSEKYDSRGSDLSDGSSSASFQFSYDRSKDNNRLLNSFPTATKAEENNPSYDNGSSYLRRSADTSDTIPNTKRNKEHVRSIYDNVDEDDGRGPKTSGRFSQLLSTEGKTNFSNNPPASNRSTPPPPSYSSITPSISSSGSRNSPTSSRFTTLPPPYVLKAPSIPPQSDSQNVHAFTLQSNSNSAFSRENTFPQTIYDIKSTTTENTDKKTSSSSNDIVVQTIQFTAKDFIGNFKNNQDSGSGGSESSDNGEFETIYDDATKPTNKMRSGSHVTVTATTTENFTNNNPPNNNKSNSSTVNVLSDSIVKQQTNDKQPQISTTPLMKPKELISKFNTKALPNVSSSSNKPEENTLQRLHKQGRTSFRCPQCKFRHVKAQGDYCEMCRTEYMTLLKQKVGTGSSKPASSETNNNTEAAAATLTTATSEANYSSNSTLKRETFPSEASNKTKVSAPLTTLNKTGISEANKNIGVNNNSSNSRTLEKVKKHVKNKMKCAQCGWKKVDVEGQCCEGCQSEYL